ncbi:MAG: FecCD family ABC transporter permease [archaeon]|nr:iron ABC transporter permease [Candidatus Bathyarchaeum sp.]
MSSNQTAKDNNKEKELPNYSKYIGRKVLFLVVFAVILVAFILIATSIGSVSLPISEVINQILNQKGIVWSIRLPRVLVGVVAGAMLAVAGTVMQCILKNPLCEPYTLGISQAASFGASFAIVILGAGATFAHTGDAVVVYNQYTVTLTAFCFALLSTGVVIILTRLTKVAPESIVLAGVVMGSIFGAGRTAMQYFADEVQLSSIVYWMFGDLSRVIWDNLFLICAISLPVLIYFIYNRWTYNAIDAGIDTANSLGVNVDRHITVGLILCSVIASVIVSMMGVIGFVGLLAPHMVRRVIGSDHRFLIPASTLVGALTLLISDTLARTIVSPLVLPVGIITSFFGGPLFLFILIRGYRK